MDNKKGLYLYDDVNGVMTKIYLYHWNSANGRYYNVQGLTDLGQHVFLGIVNLGWQSSGSSNLSVPVRNVNELSFAIYNYKELAPRIQMGLFRALWDELEI